MVTNSYTSTYWLYLLAEMVQRKHKEIETLAHRVFALNDRGNYTIPATGLYPHQWLWDSCFTAIGLRHVDAQRAAKELRSLVRGQWKNGMLPHMLLHPGDSKEFWVWQGRQHPDAPTDIATSGITQPPILAEAVWLVGQKMPKAERHSFYHAMLPKIVRYHTWLYEDRDPQNSGLVVLLHPWESGMDDSPPWITQLKRHGRPLWVKAVDFLQLDLVLAQVRRDKKYAPFGQRTDTIDNLTLYSIQRQIKRKNYETKKVLATTKFALEDLAFNAMFCKANRQLENISAEIRVPLPEKLRKNARKTESAMELFWDDEHKTYYSRSYRTKNLIRSSSIATLLPLYGGGITKKRAKELVEGLLLRPERFSTPLPIPTVPTSSSIFHSQKYWQGPVWVNMNWMIIQGLKDYGYHDEARLVRDRTLETIEIAGMREYFDPFTGHGLGGENFTWTAALALDLAHEA